MAAMWKGVEQTLVAGFIFKCHLLDSYREDIGFQDLVVQPVLIWWKNIFFIFMVVSSNILWQSVLDFLPGNLLNIFCTCQVAEDSHTSP